MGKGRLEAFSDGVLAIIITIMVLDLKIPHGDNLTYLKPVWPILISYVLSFINIGIYWNNHHHLMHAVKEVNGKVMWANMHLLFWLSLVPFASGWMGENHFATIPVAMYGFIMFMAGLAYFILTRTLTHLHDQNSALSEAIGEDKKGKVSVFIYLVGTCLSFVNAWIGFTLYAVVAAIWFFPDKRIEEKLEEKNNVTPKEG